MPYIPKPFDTPNYRKYKENNAAFIKWLDDNKDPATGALKSHDLLEEFHKRNKELNDLNDVVTAEKAVWQADEAARKAADTFESPSDPTIPSRDREDPLKSSEFKWGSLAEYFGDMIGEAMKAHRAGCVSDLPNNLLISLAPFTDSQHPDFEAAVKAVMVSTGSPGVPVFNQRISRVEFLPKRRPTIMDILPNIPTTLPAFNYLEETTWDDNAAPVAENAQKPESSFTFVSRNLIIEVIAHILRTTKQQMDDIPQFGRLVENRGMLMLDLETEDQILTGNGTSPNLLGINNKSGINTQAKGADPIPDAFYKGMTKIRTLGFAEPDLFIMHPNDWQDVRLMKTADGVYIWGNPSEEGPERMWGKPVLATTAQPEGTGLEGDFQTYSALYTIGGVEVRTVDTDGDDFKFNRLATRLERRAGAAWFRALAFAQITGI